MLTKEIITAHTKKWITDVVIGCNFCPFAAREVKRGSVFYEPVFEAGNAEALEMLSNITDKMNADADIETALLIFPDGFDDFEDYLDLVEDAEAQLETNGYEGIYQVASFHPEYQFAGADKNDPANYTNRSPYPMLHILREESVSRAVDGHPDTEAIPNTNIRYAQKMGLAYMQGLKEACMRES